MAEGRTALERAVRGWPEWEAAAKAPEQAHAEVWQEIVGVLQGSPFWRARTGGRMPALAELDVTTFDDYREAIEGSYGERVSQLNGEPIVQWVLSSGSTGTQKRFPWTPTYRAQFRRGMEHPFPFLQFLLRNQGRPHQNLRVVPPTKGLTDTGLPVGYATGLEFPNDGRIYPDEVNATPDRFLHWLPVYALAADVRSIFSPLGEPVLQILERIEADPGFYLGQLRGELERPADLRAPDISPERLAHVERVLGSGEALTFDRLWPNLKIVHTWRAGPAGLQAKRVASRCGPQVRFVDLTYGSTEGPIANPIDPDEIGGPLHPGAIIHEFVELGTTPERGNLLKPWELEPGKSYEVLLTTAMGLVRYRLGDVVSCTGRFHQVPKLRYQRRVRSELSLGATTYAEDELVEVLADVDVPPGVTCVFGPSEDGRSLVLYTREPLPQELVGRLHGAMCRANATYEGLVEHGWTARLGAEELPAAHPVWEHCRAKHTLAKPRLLLHEPPSAFTRRSAAP